jgi:hypothetical protein
MPNLLTNRLLFLTNAKYILELVKPRMPRDTPALLSLNTIRPMPESLALPLTRQIRRLALTNMAFPQISAEVDKVASGKIFRGIAGKQPLSAIDDDLIEATRKQLITRRSGRVSQKTGPADKTDPEIFERAVDNYHKHQYFCHFDWRWANWGTVADVHSAVAATFELPTTAVEFTTWWTPPIAAMQALAQMFPSVRFELSYRYRRRDPWTTMEIFPLTPFGY